MIKKGARIVTHALSSYKYLEEDHAHFVIIKKTMGFGRSSCRMVRDYPNDNDLNITKEIIRGKTICHP